MQITSFQSPRLGLNRNVQYQGQSYQAAPGLKTDLIQSASAKRVQFRSANNPRGFRLLTAASKGNLNGMRQLFAQGVNVN